MTLKCPSGLTPRNWTKVRSGKPLHIRGKGYHYEGEFFWDYWSFEGGRCDTLGADKFAFAVIIAVLAPADLTSVDKCCDLKLPGSSNWARPERAATPNLLGLLLSFPHSLTTILLVCSIVEKRWHSECGRHSHGQSA
jgi:hypothetical protein